MFLLNALFEHENSFSTATLGAVTCLGLHGNLTSPSLIEHHNGVEVCAESTTYMFKHEVLLWLLLVCRNRSRDLAVVAPEVLVWMYGQWPV